MTREEEIQEFSYHETINRDKTREFQLGIIEGAKWADEHPREGLVAIEKVIKSLERYKGLAYISFDEDFIEFFKEQMKEN